MGIIRILFTAIALLLSFGGVSKSWAQTPFSAPFGFFGRHVAPSVVNGRYHLILSNNGWNGGLGGLAGANAKCLTELTTYDWYGKAGVTLDATTVKAWLCDGSSCQDLQPNTGYLFGLANTATSGGASLYTDGSGLGPGLDMMVHVAGSLWSQVSYLGAAVQFWTGRSAGTNSTWGAGHADHCLDWVSTSNLVYGRTGGTGATPMTAVWSINSFGCNVSRRLLCAVTNMGTDDTPDPFDFTDVTLGSLSTVYESSAVITGFSGTIHASVMATNGTNRLVRKNSTGSWLRSVELSPGDTLNVQMTSPATASTSADMHVTVGRVMADWRITTAND